MKNRVFISGATGFIGRALSLKLAEAGLLVHALCRNPDHPLLIRHPRIIPFKGDITDPVSIRAAMQNCEEVYHTAALAKMWVKNKQDFYTMNVTGTRNVLHTALECGVQKVVHTSSCGVIGPTFGSIMTEEDPRISGFPIDYERTKYLADLEIPFFLQKGLAIVTVYPSRVFGPGPLTGSNTVGKLVQAYLRGRWRIIPGNGQQVANYAFLNDVVQGHIAAMEKGKAGERYILGGENIDYNHFFDLLRKISQKNYRLWSLSPRLIRGLSHFEWIKNQLTGLPPFFLPAFAERLFQDQKYSSNKAINELGYCLTPFEEAFAHTVRYHQCKTNALKHVFYE